MATPTIVAGPLTVTPALTYTTPKGVFNPVGDTSGSIPGSTIAMPHLRTTPSAPGSPVSHTLPVVLHHIPRNPDPEVAFVISAATDLGKTFTQQQILEWTDLILAIQNGQLTATVAGTVPNDEAV